MTQDFIIYYDIAAVVVMSISLASLLLRGLTTGAANRVYLTAMILVTLTASVALVGDIYDAYIRSLIMSNNLINPELTTHVRSGIALVYYGLRSLTAPAYLVLIATVSDTPHRLNNTNFRRFFLWVPMIAVLLLILTNPLHHLVYFTDHGIIERGPLMWVIYAVSLYYSIIGIVWLFRWKSILSSDEFATLMLLYPIIFAVVAIQYLIPGLRLEMFVTSIAMLLVSAFVIHPETRHDAAVDAASLDAYREMCHRAFITDKKLCLVYLGIVNMERLRELVDKDELQHIVRGVSSYLSSWLERDDVLYYLRDGLFCIEPRNTDPEHALLIARNAHEKGRERAQSLEQTFSTEMRACIVRAPENVTSDDELRAFVRRFSHLVPQTCVTTYDELSQRKDFELQMALSDIIARSLANRSFEVYYQPIFCLEDGKFHSAEALVRLNDPVYGWVPPSLFIPEAEQSGSIVDIGHILLDKICAFLGQLDFGATQLDYVEVNLSVDQCVRPELSKELLGLMQAHDVGASRINLEITETSATYSQQAIEENVRTLAQAGLSFSLDDYGTGYSNIARTLSLPFTLVKLDKSFTDSLDDPAMATVVESTTRMMKSIGKHVLVEGVETEQQLKTLAAMGVDYIQGYYFAKPMPEQEFISFLIKENS